jgi:hypothetical protein
MTSIIESLVGASGTRHHYLQTYGDYENEDYKNLREPAWYLSKY